MVTESRSCMSHSGQTKVLLVDDRSENLLAYQSTLEGLDLDLVSADSGEEALRQVLAHDFAVILLDVNMPGLDGFETAALIRQRKRSAHTPIIFVTAFADELKATEGYASGAVDFLLSPVIPEVLRAKIKVFVALFQMNEQVKHQAEERLALARERMRRLAAEETNRQLNFLAEVTAIIGRTLDYDATVRDLVRLCVPALGDQAIVARPNPTAMGWQIASARTTEKSAVAAAEVPRSEGASSGGTIPSGPLIEEFTSLDSIPKRLADAIERALDRDAPACAVDKSSDATDAKPQVAVLPLRGQKSTIAAFCISREASGRGFDSADLTIAEAMASRAAIALENAQLYKDLERLDQHKNEFLSMLAHELRNPLAPIRAAIDILRTGNNGPAPDVTLVSDIIDRQTTHLTRLVDELLDVSRITGGKIRLELAPTPVAAVVADAVETSRPLIDASNHQLDVSLPDENLWVTCDRIRLAQVLANLLNNAAKYTHPSGTISLTVRREGPHAVFRVRDNGIGIPVEMLSKVFELFTQVDRSLDRSQGGLGIGLTLVQRLVQLHGGTVEARSDGLGQGSEFTVRMDAAHEPTPSLSDVPAGAAESEKGPYRVLVVDDNVDAANTIALLLRLKKHDVRTAHDGLAAVAEARRYHPHVVILDLGLPKLDGFEVARQLRRIPETRDALLVAVSGYAQDSHRQQAIEAGFQHHLVKPVDFGALLATINGRRQQRNPMLEAANS
jgi:signal transduction histidine kinase/DNA-binding response OmpR family regulator